MAEKTGLDFDVAVVSKITLPWNTEAGYGAVAFDGTVKLNKDMVRRVNLTSEDVKKGIEKTTAKVARRVKKLRDRQPFPDLGNRSAILVDDGLASGFTMRVAVAALRNAGAGRWWRRTRGPARGCGRPRDRATPWERGRCRHGWYKP